MKHITELTKKEIKEKCYVFLDPEVKQQIQQLAKAEERSPSAQIRLLVHKALGLSEQKGVSK